MEYFNPPSSPSSSGPNSETERTVGEAAGGAEGAPKSKPGYAFKCHRRGVLAFPVNDIAFHPIYGTIWYDLYAITRYDVIWLENRNIARLFVIVAYNNNIWFWVALCRHFCHWWQRRHRELLGRVQQEEAMPAAPVPDIYSIAFIQVNSSSNSIERNVGGMKKPVELYSSLLNSLLQFILYYYFISCALPFIDQYCKNLTHCQWIPCY